MASGGGENAAACLVVFLSSWFLLNVPKNRKIRVLVVDNEEEFATTLAERLRLRKLEVRAAFSGAETLALLPEFLPDVIVLDVQMPAMDGLQVLFRVKAFDPGIQVILVTGHTSFESGIAGMELGAFDYLVKPIDLSHLLAKIDEAYRLKNSN